MLQIIVTNKSCDALRAATLRRKDFGWSRDQSVRHVAVLTSTSSTRSKM